MNSNRSKWIVGLVIGAAAVTLLGAVHARDPGINQPGVVGGVPGGGAPVGLARTRHQPARRGWQCRRGRGRRRRARGRCAGSWHQSARRHWQRRDAGSRGRRTWGRGSGPGINQPGAIGNTNPGRRGTRRLSYSPAGSGQGSVCRGRAAPVCTAGCTHPDQPADPPPAGQGPEAREVCGVGRLGTHFCFERTRSESLSLRPSLPAQ